MANINADPKWSSVRILEQLELARGGINGNMNEQAKALAERTEFLKQNSATKDELFNVSGGLYAFSTMQKALEKVQTLPEHSKIEIQNDGKNNGQYLWESGVLTPSDYDPLSQTKPFIDVLANTNQRQSTTFYHAPNKVIKKESNEGLFAVAIKVQPGQKYVVNLKSFGVVGGYYIADKDGNVLQTLASTEMLEQDYVITILENAHMLYVNCLNSYNNFKLYLLISELKNLKFTDLEARDFTFFSNDNGLIGNTNIGFFSKTYDVVADEYYLIRTATYGTAPQHIITNSSGEVIVLEPSGDRGKNYIIRIPKNASKLYVNCTYARRNNFKVEKISDVLSKSLKIGELIQDFTFFYGVNNVIKKESNEALFALDINVKAGQKYSILTKTFGVVGEQYITDDLGNILQFKASDSSEEEYIITIPENASKLYVNCTYDFADNFNFERISNALLAKISDVGHSVRSVFPQLNYFDQLQKKCPKFYQKFKEKLQDVTVVLTGTSLTQGNFEYTSDREDASMRPAALHTHDLASSIFDVLVKHWDGQKYRRYDHADLTYSNSSWTVVNQLPDYVWDDYAHIKNGLTKTTTGANANVSMTMPSNAWQFNFIYRSDSQCGDCTVVIAEGNSKVEVYNGSSWVEANGYKFTMYESPATATKGNTQYQKRLKMRCKNKLSGGINSIGSTKQITISKGNNSNRFNVIGFEWSPREFMLSVINGARGGFEWGDPTGNRLDQYQDTDIWSFNPDLLLAEITVINWGASETNAMSVDPLHYVNITKRAYFNEFNDMPTSLYAKSEAYTKCDVIFYADTLAATSAVAGAWDSSTHEPKFGTVIEAAKNGLIIDESNIGRVKTNFENYEAVESYMATKEYLFIPILSTFKSVAEDFYGSYWAGMQPSGKDGSTLSYDGVHFNDNGAALFSKIVASVFDGI